MIGNASLRIIVGANLGRTVAGRNHGFTLRTYFVEIFLVFDSINTRTKFNHGFGFVLMLRFFVLALHGDSRRDMHQTNGGIGGIHRLPSGSRRTESIHTNIRFFQFDVKFLRFGQYCNRCGGSMHASLCFGLRYALHAMHTRFVFQRSIYIFARNGKNNFLVSTRCSFAHIGNFKFPTFCFAVFYIHFKQISCKNGRLVATGSAANFDDGILVIFGIGRNQQQLDIFLHFGYFRFNGVNFAFGHFTHFRISFGI